MYDCVAARDDPIKKVVVKNRTLHEFDVRDTIEIGGATRTQVIEDDNRVARRKSAGEIGTDESGATGDHDSHEVSLVTEPNHGLSAPAVVLLLAVLAVNRGAELAELAAQPGGRRP